MAVKIPVYASGEEAQVGDVIECIDGTVTDSICKIETGTQHVVSKLNAGTDVMVGPRGKKTSWQATRFKLISRKAATDPTGPQWQPKPTCAGLWVYRVENKFWLQSVMFQAMFIAEDHIGLWVPRWGDDPIIEVYGPLSLSVDGTKNFRANERKIARRNAKR